MQEITGITPQVKDKTRCNIFLDGKFYCGLKLEVVVKHRLKVGMKVEENFLSQIQLDSEKSVALDKTLTYITATQKTEKQIRDYLYKKGYLSTVVEYVLEKLRDYRFVDDKDYAETYAKSYATRKGKRLIKMELYKKGIKKEEIESALNEVDEDTQIQTASGLVEKYMRSKTPDRQTLAKAFRYLVSKGFDYDVAKKALENYGELLEEGEE
ncbi:MAG: RecX family transcriptional regulator [Clostridia bacterium]|nr:RecX family transcriptional regulator [Clostridia bacterium]